MNADFLPRRVLRWALLWLVGVAALVASLSNPTLAVDCVIPRHRHPWAAFQPGSWKQVRVTTETLNGIGEVTSTTVTETHSMLMAVDATSYELQIDVTVQVGGKQFASDTKNTRQGLQGESPNQNVKVRDLGEKEIQVDQRTLRVQQAEIEITDKESRRVTQLQYLESGMPYVLARESTTYDAAGKVLQETTVTTEKLDVARILLGYRHRTWTTRTVQKHAGGRIVTDEIHAAEVPGGVVEHTSEEFDAAGKLIRRSKLELVNFGVAKEGTRPKMRRPERKSRRKSG